jgi:hypothetical protein
MVRHLRLRTRLKLRRLMLRLLRLVLLRLMRLLVLRLMLIVLRLVLIVLRLTLVERLRLWRVGLADLRLIIAVIVAVVGHIAAHSTARLLLLKIGLILAKLFLRGGDQTEIMLGMLIIIFGGDRISGALRVAGELEIFFSNVRGRSPDFYVRPIGLVHSRQRILVMMATLTATTAHAFIILTVSHGLLFRQPRFARRQRRRRICP